MTEQPRAGNRHPDLPPDGPSRGWWGTLRRAAGSVVRHHLTDEAGGVAFFALLALVPALTALVSLYGLFADPAAVAEHLDALAAVAPDRGTRVIGDYVRRLAADDRGALGLGALGGAAALWSMNRAVRVLVRGMNRVYGGREAGGFLTRTARTLALTLGGVLFALLAVGAVVVLPFALRFLGLGGVMDFLLRFLRWPLLLAAATVFLACLYRYGPCRAEPRWRWVSWGGAFAAFAWLLGSAALSWYVGDLGAGSQAHGPFGAVIGFMTWLWLSAVAVLAGAALNAEMERGAGGQPGAGHAGPGAAPGPSR